MSNERTDDHKNLNKIVFDIETQKTFDEVGGRHKTENLGISLLGAFSYSQKKFFTFTESEIQLFEKILIVEKPLLIGFNSIHFDNAVLQPYLKDVNLSEFKHLDILEEVVKSIKTRLKLETIAQATLGEGKSGTGLDAIEFFRKKDFQSLARYCLDDVRITRDLYEYGLRHGHVWYSNYGTFRKIPISWGSRPTIGEFLRESCDRHEAIEIEYGIFSPSGRSVVKKEIEIQSIGGESMIGCDVRTHEEETLDIKNIFSFKKTGHIHAYQASLL